MRRWLWTVALLVGASRAATLTGFVNDSRDRAVPGATVWYAADDPSGGPTVAPVTAAADGSFALTLPDVAAAGGALIAHATGRGAAVHRLAASQPPVLLRLRSTGPVEGLVLDAQRRPVAGAVVRPVMFWPPRGFARVPPELAERLWSATTDAAGRWRLDDLPADTRRDFEARAAGYALARVAVGSGYQPPPASYAILKPGGGLTGRVLLPDGRPAAGLWLMADPEWTMTGADGAYTLAHQPISQAAIRVMRPADATWAEPPFFGAMVVPGTTSHAPDLRLPRGVRIAGTVVDQVSGAPLEGCRVDWRSIDRPGAAAYSDASGRYEVVVAPGDYTAVAGASEPGRPVRITVVDGAMAPVQLSAPRCGYRRVRLQLRDGDRPTARENVWLAVDGQTRWVTSDDLGQVEARLPLGQRVLFDPPPPVGQPQGPPEPPAIVRVVLADPWRQGQVDVPEGAMLVDLPLTECPLTTVTGRVHDTGGGPVVGAQVLLRMAP
ncbi:MAG: hypothetical protein HZB16_22435, partial [Armatimonadetes bacterium]|nr:hypothetical protein [Armatimonadota bacterium]